MSQLRTTEAPTRPINWPALCEAALLGLIAALLLSKTLRGVLAFYIHPRYAPFVIVCSIVLLAIAGVRMRATFSVTPERFGGRQLGYLLLLAALLAGVFVPAAPLGADTLGGRGLASLNNGAARWRNQPDGSDTSGWNLLDWTSALSTSDAQHDGAEVLVDGFVLRQPEAGSAVYVARYVVTCCAADASGVGLPIVWAESAKLATDSWVRVHGKLGATTINGQREPAIVAESIEQIAQPPQPYLYP